MNRNRQRGPGRRGIQQRHMGANGRTRVPNTTQQRITTSPQEFSMLEVSPLQSIIDQVLDTASRLVKEFRSEKHEPKKLQQVQSKPLSYPIVDPDTCTGCGICADTCPVNAISIDSVAIIDESLCTGCRQCFEACTRGAITFVEKG